VLDQVVNHPFETAHHLGVGQIVPLDSGQHVQELLAPGRPGRMLPGNGKRVAASRAFDTWVEAGYDNLCDAARKICVT
jgi:hypothetical protein